MKERKRERENVVVGAKEESKMERQIGRFFFVFGPTKEEAFRCLARPIGRVRRWSRRSLAMNVRE